MSTSDENDRQVLYISSGIPNFRNVSTLADYLATKSTMDQSVPGDVGRGWLTSSVGWLRSLSRSDKLTMVTVIGASVIAIVTVAMFVYALR